MDIKVGEYVRTSKGYIFKIEHNKMVQGLKFLNAQYGNIRKNSTNIIDLIEVGDIVEYQVNSLSELKVGRVKSYRNARSNKEYLGVEGFDITKIYIKTILTHEQYNVNCYKVR